MKSFFQLTPFFYRPTQILKRLCRFVHHFEAVTLTPKIKLMLSISRNWLSKLEQGRKIAFPCLFTTDTHLVTLKGYKKSATANEVWSSPLLPEIAVIQ